MPRKRLIRLATVSGTCLLLLACTTVEPWQRGHLARREMASPPNPSLSALRDHLHGSRESTSGGHTSEGGGCGCT